MPIRADTLSGHGAYYRNAPSDTTFYPSLFESLVLEAGKGIEESTFRSDSSTAHRDCVYLWFEDPKTIHVTLLRDGAKVGEKTVKGQVSDEGTYELNANRSIAGYPPFLNVYAAQKTWMAWTAPQTLQVHRALETVGFLVVMPFDGDDYVFRSTYRKVSNPWTDC